VSAAGTSVCLALLAGLLLADPGAGVARLTRLRRIPAGPVGDLAPFGRTDSRRPPWLGRATAAVAGLALVTGHGSVACALAVLALGLRLVGQRTRRAARQVSSAMAADLPRAAELLATCLEAGATPADALSAVADALGAPLSGRLRPVVAALAAGADLSRWPAEPADPVDRLVRTVARASRTGAPMAESVRLLAVDERERARWEALERARRAGVQAVGPLAACFLPAFVLLGVVPVVVGVARTVLAGWA
jgi:pilus assembly protein TadC